MLVIELVQALARNMRNEHEGTLKICMYCKVAWEMITADRLKANQYETYGRSKVSNMLEIEQKRCNSNACMKNQQKNEELNNSKVKLTVPKCDKKSKEERIKCKEQCKNECVIFKGSASLNLRHR